VVVTVGGLASNGVAFTVTTPPVISGLFPSSGAAGTVVTITGANFDAAQGSSTVTFNGINAGNTTTGTGFGAAQGTGQIWLGTAYGVVQTWSDTQIMAQVAAGSLSGSAQVLQGGVGTAFTVNTLHVSSVTPNSGGPATSVTIAGAGFGQTQGTGTLLLGSLPGQVVNSTTPQMWRRPYISIPQPESGGKC
jgi:hypothetical protein